MANERRFFEIKNVTGNSQEPLEFTLQSNSETLVANPRDKRLTVIKSSQNVYGKSLVITKQNKYNYVLVMGEVDTSFTNHYENKKPKPMDKRNRFCSAWFGQNGQSGTAQGWASVMDHACGLPSYLVLEEGVYNSVEEIIANFNKQRGGYWLGNWMLSSDGIRRPSFYTEIDITYNKEKQQIEVNQAPSLYSMWTRHDANNETLPDPLTDITDPNVDPSMAYPYFNDWFSHTLYCTRELAKYLDPNNELFVEVTNWKDNDVLILDEGSPITLQTPRPDEMDGWDINQIYGNGSHIAPSVRVQTDWDLSNMNSYDQSIAVKINVDDLVMLDNYGAELSSKNRDRRTKLNADAPLKGVFYDPDQEEIYSYWRTFKKYPYWNINAWGKYTQFYTIVKNKVENLGANLIKAIKFKSSSINVEKTVVTSNDNNREFIEEPVVVNISILSDYDGESTIEYQPSLDLQSYKILDHNDLSLIKLKCYIEYINGLEVPAMQMQNTLSSILFKIE